MLVAKRGVLYVGNQASARRSASIGAGGAALRFLLAVIAYIAATVYVLVVIALTVFVLGALLTPGFMQVLFPTLDEVPHHSGISFAVALIRWSGCLLLTSLGADTFCIAALMLGRTVWRWFKAVRKWL